MSARMTGYRPPLDSDNESDEDTSQSLRQNVSKGLRHPSDTESSDERHAIAQSPISNAKYNRELKYVSIVQFIKCSSTRMINFCFSLRRVKLDPQRIKSVSSITSKVKSLSQDICAKPESTSNVVSRIDSGRPSTRVSRASSMVSLKQLSLSFSINLLCYLYRVFNKRGWLFLVEYSVYVMIYAHILHVCIHTHHTNIYGMFRGLKTNQRRQKSPQCQMYER